MEDLPITRPPALLAEIERRTAAFGFPMASEPRTGALLRTLAAAKPGGRLLELGTGTGLATAWLLDGMNPHATLTTVDIDPSAQAIAREVLGADPRLEIITQDAGVFVAGLTASESRDGSGGFDLIFADAMVGKSRNAGPRAGTAASRRICTSSTTCCRKQAGPRDTRPGSPA